MHALSEARRLRHPSNVEVPSASYTHQNVLAAKKDLTRRGLVVLAGHAGSGVASIGTQLRTQLADRLHNGASKHSLTFETVCVDLADFALKNSTTSPGDQLAHFLQPSLTKDAMAANAVLVVLTLSATTRTKLCDVLSRLSTLLVATLTSVLSVVAPSAVHFGSGIADG